VLEQCAVEPCGAEAEFHALPGVRSVQPVLSQASEETGTEFLLLAVGEQHQPALAVPSDERIPHGQCGGAPGDGDGLSVLIGESVHAVEPAGGPDTEDAALAAAPAHTLDGGQDRGALDGCGGGDGGHGSSRQLISMLAPSSTWLPISRTMSSSAAPRCQVTVRRPERRAGVGVSGSGVGDGAGAGVVLARRLTHCQAAASKALVAFASGRCSSCPARASSRSWRIEAAERPASPPLSMPSTRGRARSRSRVVAARATSRALARERPSSCSLASKEAAARCWRSGRPLSVASASISAALSSAAVSRALTVMPRCSDTAPSALFRAWASSRSAVAFSWTCWARVVTLAAVR